MSFVMVLNSFEFYFKQSSFNPFKSPDRKSFQDDRDPDLKYFNEINILNKETTYINETDIKNFLYEKHLFFMLTSED